MEIDQRELVLEMLHDVDMNMPSARPVKYIPVITCLSCNIKFASKKKLDRCPRCKSYDLEDNRMNEDEVYGKNSHIIILGGL